MQQTAGKPGSVVGRGPARCVKLYCVLASLLISLTHLQANEGWRIDQADDWVSKAGFSGEPADSAAGTTGGIHYLLLDKQYRITESGISMYHHCACRIENQSGIAELSQLSLTFDPSYETLRLHEIVVHRGQTASSRLRPDAVSVLRREQGLEYQILDGRRTAHVVLDDIRVGDIVEYSYTLSGVNPVFAGRSYFAFFLQFPVAVRRLQVRILWEKHTPMHFKAFHCQGLEPSVRRFNGSTEYVWDIRDRPGLHWEEDTPSWYQPYSQVQVSDSPSWQQVTDWALPLYRIGPADAALCARLARTLTSGKEGDRQKADALLKYVQKQVRYTGLEIGPHNYAPNPPETILERHFGDCKDKSLLLVSLLRAVDIEAYPALVSGDRRGHVEEMLPSPLAFDHVIVLAFVDGLEYFLDPTLTFHEGVLDDTPSRFYGRALVVKEGSTDLLEIEEPDLAQPTVAVRERFDTREGMDGPAHLRVESEYRMFSANHVRAYVDSQSARQIEKDCLNFLERYYSGLEWAQPIEIHDQAESNRLTIVESYRVPRIWQYDEELKSYQLIVHPYQLYPHTEKPETLRRHMPLALSYPLFVEHTLEVELFEPWRVDDEKLRIENPAFTFSSSVKYSEDGKLVRISYHLKTLKDSVPPKDLNRYLKDLEKVEEDLGYVFSFSPGGAVSPASLFGVDWQDLLGNWSFLAVSGLSLAAAILLARKLYLFDPPPLMPSGIDFTLRGVSGWLILFAFKVYLTPLASLAILSDTLSRYQMSSWQMHTGSLSNVLDVGRGLWLMAELIVNIGLLVLSILLIVLFRKRRHTFPRLYLFINIGWTVFMFLDRLAVYLLFRDSPFVPQPPFSTFIASIITTVVWCLYAGYSRRVKATFSERLPAAASEVRPA